MKIRFIMPLLFFTLIGLILWRGLNLHPAEIPSPFINKPTPRFELPLLFDQQHITTNNAFMGHVTLLNVWATWCVTCADEHQFLLTLTHDKNLSLFGLNYKDDPVAAKKWLTEKGNPYQLIAVDTAGAAAIDWGVYGTPETFLIDKRGIVRYKRVGPLSKEVWEENIAPLVLKLQAEAE
jgi:cytochrome c biogenesis protein CcmG/thiol:disulfide interchange protein DsbE